MKKVKIITILDINYGNRLQNYAMQQILRSIGYEVQTIGSNKACYRGDYTFKNPINLLKRIEILIKFFLKKILVLLFPNCKLSRKIIQHDTRKLKKFNLNLFDEFNKKISFDESYKRYLKGYSEDDCIYVVGSDQVWNTNFFSNQYLFMLGFSKNKENNIAISPSIGINYIDSESVNEFKKYIYNFKAISCREISGAKLIKKHFNIECEVLLDPTLILSKEEWILVEKKPKKFTDKKYILVYFLGEINDEKMGEIIKISEKNKFKIINISYINKNSFPVGPSEFIYLIHNAELIVTDSYHALIFSIIFEESPLIAG